MNQTNTAFVTALSIILLGYLLKQKNIVSEKEGKVISKLLMNSTFPALIFITMVRVKIELNLLFLPFIAFCFSVLTMYSARYVFKNQAKQLKALLIMGCGGFNLGLFAYPLIDGIWGPAGMVYAAMFDSGNSFAVFGLVYGTGVFMSEGNAEISKRENIKKAFIKIITLLPFQAILLGIFVNLSEIQLPEEVLYILDVLAKGNKVMVLLIMGIYLNFSIPKEIFKKSINVLLIRYFWGLLLGFIFLYYLPVEQLYRNVLLIILIVPVGMTLLPFSDELGYDTKTAGVLVNLSMLISFVLMWGLVVGLKLF
jgi:malate permease and related proteins